MESANKVVGKPYPKAWIIGKTIEQITNEKPKPNGTRDKSPKG
jgi:hypothetical protein